MFFGLLANKLVVLAAPLKQNILLHPPLPKRLSGTNDCSPVFGKHPLSYPLFIDNQGALRLIKNLEFHRWTKHINIQHHVIRVAILADHLLPSFVSTHDQLANIFTKALPKETFQRMCHQLGMCLVEH